MPMVADVKRDFELILLTLERDLPVLESGINFIRAFLQPAKITFIASAACIERARTIDALGNSIHYLDEDLVAPGLTLGVVRAMLTERGANIRRAGWYFKQIALFAYATRPGTLPYYLAWDADTIPTRPIDFFDLEGRTLLTVKDEHNPAYFRTMVRLIDMEKSLARSFIAEHMMFDKRVMLALIKRILGDESRDCSRLAALILGAVGDEDLSGSGFSEYETYGTFATREFADAIMARDLPSLRRGTDFYGRPPSCKALFAISLRYAWVSFEAWSSISDGPAWKHVVRRALGATSTLFAVMTRPVQFLKFKRVAKLDHAMV